MNNWFHVQLGHRVISTRWKNPVHGLLVLATLCFYLLSLSACSLAPDSIRPVPSETTAKTAVATLEGDSPANPIESLPQSAPIRLWWSPRTDLNPLLDQSASGQSIHSLVFQGLFDHDEQWNLVPVLASNYSFQPDRMELTLVIRPDVAFHNGQLLTAQDVLACLNFIRQAGPASPFFQSLSAYGGGRLIDDQTLVIQLNQQSPGFLHALTFPVLPATDLYKSPGSLIAGSGKYQMLSFDTDGSLDLLWSKESSRESISMPRIHVQPFDDAVSAMKALENDGLDLVFLPEEHLAQYHVRSSLRLDRVMGRRFVFIAINPQRANTSDHSDLILRNLLRAGRWFDSRQDWPGQAATLPIPAFHAAFGSQALDYQTLYSAALAEAGLSSDTRTLPGSGLRLRLVAPENQPLLLQVANQAHRWLTEAGYLVELSPLEPQSYRQAIAAESYDLVVCEAVIPESAEPGWIREPLGDLILASPAILPMDDQVAIDSAEQSLVTPVEMASGLPYDLQKRYDKENDPLAVGWPYYDWLGSSRPILAEENQILQRQYREALVDLALSTPFLGVMLRESATAYGDRVVGQLRPNRGNPYQGIEELWVWSGLSS
jgi:peptide/nickel transport system substrate-binding protein